MALTVTALEPQRRNPELVDLHIDGELRGSIAYVVISAERVRAGDVIAAETLDRILAADERWKAKHAALSLLAARARARGELADRLRRKGFGDAAVRSALAEVERLGLVDDQAFAESWVRDRLRLRPRGTHALVYELGRKGVAAEVARAAVIRVMKHEHVCDDDLCMAAAQRWADSHTRASGADDPRRLERRLSTYLGRRGYPPGSIRAAVAVVLRGGSTVRSGLADDQ